MVGYTGGESTRLQELTQRDQQGTSREDLTAQDLHRLAFGRWLVMQGRLQRQRVSERALLAAICVNARYRFGGVLARPDAAG